MSKEYKSLNLNREKIKEEIERYLSIYFDEFQVGTFENKDNTRKRIGIDTPKGRFYIDFHFNANGTTTIENFGGAQEYIDMKKEIAKSIKDNCGINCSCNDSWFVAKNIDKEDFDLVLEMLVESEYHSGDSIDYKNETEGKVMYKLRGKYNEELTITYYDTKTVLVQGKILLLFNEALESFGELLDEGDIPRCFNKLYKLNIDKDAVREQVKMLMKDSYDKFPNKLNKCIHQAVYYLLIDGEMFEYSALPLTAFRALEGHIKYAFKEFKIYTSKDKPIGSFYEKDKNSQKYVLRKDTLNRINSNYKIIKLQEAYNKYHDLRHVLSHWDDLQEDTDIDTTEIIDNIGIAKTYIKDTLNIINSYYTLANML